MLGSQASSSLYPSSSGTPAESEPSYPGSGPGCSTGYTPALLPLNISFSLQVPELVQQGGRLIESVIKAANDTAPLILNVSSIPKRKYDNIEISVTQGIEEFTDQLPLIASFASAYAEVNAEQAQKVSVDCRHTAKPCLT